MSDKLSAALVSLTIHLGFFALLAVSFAEDPPKPAPPAPSGKPVEAVAVDKARVDAELKRLKSQEAAKQAHQRRLKEEATAAQRQREREQRELAVLKRKRAEEEKRRAAESKHLAKLKAQKEALEKQRQAEQKRLAALEAQAKAEAEKKRKAEAERKRLEEEKRRKQEELKRLEAERQRQEAEQALKKKLAAEQKRLQAERSQHLSLLKAQYIADIQNKVERNWLRPSGVTPGTACKVLVQQLPGGDVASVRIVKSSGNPVFDRSVESAVNRAAPLPAPPEPSVFDREIQFTFEAR